MKRWTIDHHMGWLRITDAASITCVEAQRVAAFGTTTGGFVVKTSAEELYFECEAEEARECVDALFTLLAV